MERRYAKVLSENPTTTNERKTNAEVLTPIKLVKEMIAKIPRIKKSDKIFDPCVGKGAFMVVMYDKLIKKYSKKHVLENMLYFADINPINIFITKLILDPHNKYKLNYYTGDSLKMDSEKIWGVKKFNIILFLREHVIHSIWSPSGFLK